MKGFFKGLLAAIIGTFIAMFLTLMVIIAIFSASSSPSTPKKPSKAILMVDLAEPITEDDASADIFSSFDYMSMSMPKAGVSIYNAIKAIKAAETDSAIKFLYLNTNSLNISIANLEELRKAIKEFRESGKAVIAYADNYTQTSLYLASVADKVYINVDGSGAITGISLSIQFFKELIDKFGIDIQLIRHGKYKAAAEQFVSSNISKENYEQNYRMIESMWEEIKGGICESREIDMEKFDTMVDNLELFSPESLVENKIVDAALTRGEFTEQLCTLFDVRSDSDLQFLSLAKYSKNYVKGSLSKNKVAVIYANGEITMDGEGLSVSKFYPIINKIKKDSTIKAVVLRVNSPGGDAQAANILNDELLKLKENKPLVVSMGEYAASGGYWISAKADRIFADNTTLTGSIGVFSLYFSFEEALKKSLKVNSVTISTNKNSSVLNGINKLNPMQEEFMQSMVEDVYTKFNILVAQGRDLRTSYVDSIAQGRVWTGADALTIGLVDEIGGVNDAIEYAASLCDFSDYKVVQYPKPENTFDKLFNQLMDNSASVKALSDPLQLVKECYIEPLMEENMKIYARIPYIYTIK